MNKWKRMKGLYKAKYACDKCRGGFDVDEFDESENMCLYCLFSGTSSRRPAEIDTSLGYNRNRTKEGQLLDKLEYVQEKESKAGRRFNDNKKVYSGRLRKKPVKKKKKSSSKKKNL